MTPTNEPAATPAPGPGPEGTWDVKALAERFDVAPVTVRGWKRTGALPTPKMLAGGSVWTAEQIGRFEQPKRGRPPKATPADD